MNKVAILNLDESFTPLGKENSLKFHKFAFPSGVEPHIKIDPPLYYDFNTVAIVTRMRNMEDLMTLLLATDALKRMAFNKDKKFRIKVFIPFLPFARQDRIMVNGEPFSLKVVCDIINAQKYTGVTLYDVHSDIAPALINNCTSIKNHVFVEEVLSDKVNYLIVSPDAGSYKKIFPLCQYLDYKDEIIICDKIRDVATGKLHGVTVTTADLHGKDVYIVDDICDGGGTFLLLAKELRKRNCGKINIIVSHGIFSQGETSLRDCIDHIYTTDSFKDIQSDFITQIKLR